MKHTYYLLGSALLVFASPARAQTTLIGWDVNGVSEGTTSLTASTFTTNILNDLSSGVLSRGVGAALPGNPAANSFGASGFSALTLDDAISSADYFSFNLAPAAGYTMTLSSVTMKLSTTLSGPTNGALFSSVAGFGSAESAIQSFTMTGDAINDQTITLTFPAFADLNTTVEFRLYAYGSGTDTRDKLRFRDLTNSDLTIAGTTASAIPEPSTYAAAAGALALIGAMWYRRRKGRA